jgi:anti-sigma B factor antagonist
VVLTMVKYHAGSSASHGCEERVFEHSPADRNQLRVLRLSGRLDFLSAPAFSARLDALVATFPLAVILDLRELEFIDSSGVGAIVALFKRLRVIGGGLTIAGLGGQPKEIFRILRLERAFDILPTVADAARRIGQEAPVAHGPAPSSAMAVQVRARQAPAEASSHDARGDGPSEHRAAIRFSRPRSRILVPPSARLRASHR